MKGNPEERAIMLGEYITQTNATVRSAAKAFGVSKSTVHKDVTVRRIICSFLMVLDMVQYNTYM